MEDIDFDINEGLENTEDNGVSGFQKPLPPNEDATSDASDDEDMEKRIRTVNRFKLKKC